MRIFCFTASVPCELLERMKAAGKSWELSVFASANAIRKYTMLKNWWSWEFRGCGWGWNRRSPAMASCKGADTQQLTARACANTASGARARPSSGWSTTRRKILSSEIEYAVAHETDFHQFMLYTPVPGTPLIRRWRSRAGCWTASIWPIFMGSTSSTFEHGAISQEDSKRFLDWAFWRDFERNGPSLYRICQTMLQGWQRYKDYPDPRVRERFARQVSKMLAPTMRRCGRWSANSRK